MQTAQRTKLLLVLLVVAGIAAIWAWSSMSSARDRAVAAQRDLSLCRQEIADLDRWQGAPTSASLTPDDPELNRRLRGAATVAQMTDQLVSIEPGPAIRIRESDFTQTPIYLRLNAVTLGQLVTFLHQLSTSDASLHTSAIEMSIPQTAPGNVDDSSEAWTADVTLAYLTYAPKSGPNP
jgi:hypothetical protein